MSVCVCVCVSVCLSVCLSDLSPNVQPKPIDRFVKNRYLGPSRKYLEPFFSFPPNPKIKGSSHKIKIKKIHFLKNGSNDFD